MCQDFNHVVSSTCPWAVVVHTVLEVGRSHLNNASVSVAQGDVGGQLPIQSRSYPGWEYKCKLILKIKFKYK